MEFTFSKGQFDVPEGKYLAQFLGGKPLEDKGKLGNDGKPLPPAMAWEFQIVEGEHAGKKCDRVTGRQPTPKNGCGKMLAAITDQILKDGQQYDAAPFVGKLYRVTIEQKESGQGTRVSDTPAPVRVYDGQASPPAAAGTAAPSAPPPPPRRPGPAKPPEPLYYLEMPEGDPVQLTAPQLKEEVIRGKLDVSAINICPVGGSEWKPIAQVFPDAGGWVLPF